MRGAGILHDVEATDKSIAAGGKNSVKGEFGVSDPYATPGARKATAAELMQKIDRIQRISLRVTRDLSFTNFRFVLMQGMYFSPRVPWFSRVGACR